MKLALPGVVSLLVVCHAAHGSAIPLEETGTTDPNHYGTLPPSSNDAFASSPFGQTNSGHYNPYSSLVNTNPITSFNRNNPYLPENKVKDDPPLVPTLKITPSSNSNAHVRHDTVRSNISDDDDDDDNVHRIVTYSRNPQRGASFDDAMDHLFSQPGAPSSSSRLALQPQIISQQESPNHIAINGGDDVEEFASSPYPDAQRSSPYSMLEGNTSEDTLVNFAATNETPNNIPVAPLLGRIPQPLLPPTSPLTTGPRAENRYAQPPTQPMNSQQGLSPKQRINIILQQARDRYAKDRVVSLPFNWFGRFSQRNVYGIRVRKGDIYVDSPAAIKQYKQARYPIKYRGYFTLPKDASKDNDEEKLWRRLAEAYKVPLTYANGVPPYTN